MICLFWFITLSMRRKETIKVLKASSIHSHCTPPPENKNKIKSVPAAAGKVMTTVFWISKGVLLDDCLVSNRNFQGQFRLPWTMPYNNRSSPVNIFTDRSEAVPILVIICGNYILCLSCFCVCSLLPCGHLKANGWPLGSCFWCLLWFCYFPIWYLGTGMVRDCADSWSLLSFLLLLCILITTSVTSLQFWWQLNCRWSLVSTFYCFKRYFPFYSTVLVRKIDTTITGSNVYHSSLENCWPQVESLSLHQKGWQLHCHLFCFNTLFSTAKCSMLIFWNGWFVKKSRRLVVESCMYLYVLLSSSQVRCCHGYHSSMYIAVGGPFINFPDFSNFVYCMTSFTLD